jgi:hypothetical protein
VRNNFTYREDFPFFPAESQLEEAYLSQISVLVAYPNTRRFSTSNYPTTLSVFSLFIVSQLSGALAEGGRSGGPCPPYPLLLRPVGKLEICYAVAIFVVKHTCIYEHKFSFSSLFDNVKHF